MGSLVVDSSPPPLHYGDNVPDPLDPRSTSSRFACFEEFLDLALGIVVHLQDRTTGSLLRFPISVSLRFDLPDTPLSPGMDSGPVASV